MTDAAAASRTVRVALPVHLRTLARIDGGGEVSVDVAGTPTISAVLDAVEARWPMLRGTIRDHGTGARRAYVRYFAGRRDLSHEPPETPLPEEVASGDDVFTVIGAIAGG